MRLHHFLIPLLALVCQAQVKVSRFQQRDAWTVESSGLRVTIMQSGGHVAEIALREPGAVNPLWIQSRPTIDPDRYDPALHEKLYGGAASARLMSGLLGHSLCFPYWGNPSATEAAAGMAFHGEAGVVRWRRLDSAPAALTVAAELPESHTRITRSVRVAGQVAWFDETAENETAWDRPVGWCEHVTLGPPFLETGVTTFDASLTRGRFETREFTWPHGMAGVAVDLRHYGAAGSSGFVNNFLVDPAREYGFFTAFHPRLRLLIGYVFRREEFPWLNIWEAHDPALLTRGMEFSNTPVHGTMKVMLANPRVFGRDTFEWLDAKGRLHKRYAAFSTRVPENYKGVADVILAGATVTVVERETGRRITLP